MKPNKSLAIHCHHDILVEYCYDYKERVKYIKQDKPENEIKTRLKLFKILPQKALKDTPKSYQKADAEWQKAYAEWQKTYDEWQKADAERQKAAEWQKTDDERQKAYDEWQKAYAEWPQRSKDAFHKKWCGCKEWNGRKLVFKQL